MNSLSNNKWLTESPLFKNKTQRYYYDFGTGKKIETEEAKKKEMLFSTPQAKPQPNPKSRKRMTS